MWGFVFAELGIVWSALRSTQKEDTRRCADKIVMPSPKNKRNRCRPASRTFLSGLFNLFDCSASSSLVRVCVCVWLDLFKHVSALCSFLFEWFSLYTIDFWIDKRCPPSSSHSSSRCVRQAATCSIVLVLLHVCTCHYLSIVLVAPIFSSGAVVESSGLGLGRLWCATWCGVCESERMSHAEAVGECRVENVL